MACDNPSYINTTNVNNFGFTTVFDPYAKTVTFDISDLTTFKSGGAAHITSVAFTVVNSNGSTYTGTINPSVSLNPLVISGLDGGQLFFGQYTITAVLTEANASTYSIQIKPIVCADNRLEYGNYIKACIEANTDCASAKLVIKDVTNKQYAGLSPKENSTTYDVAIIYPKNYLAQKDVTFLPYSLSLANSITGPYQIPTVITVGYDLGCDVTLNIQYRASVLKEVECGNGLGELSCCWQDALSIVEMGGTKGAQMQEAMDEASDYFIEAFLLWSSGANNDKAVKKVKEILNCDCKCQKGVIIQPDPITFGNKNITDACGTTVSTDGNGDIVISSYIYTIAKNTGDDKITLTTTTLGDCTKQTLIQINCDAIERCIYGILSSDEDILQQWQDLLGITGDCPCADVTEVDSLEVKEVVRDGTLDALEDNYFSRNETISKVVYDSSVVVTGGDVSMVVIYDQALGNQTQLSSGGANEAEIPANTCASNLIGITSEVKATQNVFTTCGCVFPNEYFISIDKVPYGERYNYGYRFNPQINEEPIVETVELIDGTYYTIQEVIFADSYYAGSSASEGSVIRGIRIKTDPSGNSSFHETRSLIGNKKVGATIVTNNNSWGDICELDYASSVCLDTSEIVNGYPVMYFGTFGGALCRAVRERDNQCDERANWKVYVIQGGSGGSEIYGIKKWKTDENGNLTFLYVDAGASNVKVLLFDNSGSKNSATNWSSVVLFSTTGSSENINIFNNNIYLLGANNIKCYPYSGASTQSALATALNYTANSHNLASGTVVVPNTYADGAGDVATIDEPNSLWKIGNKYYFSNARHGSAARGSYIRYFTIDVENPNGPEDYTFTTEIVVNANSNLNSGTWVTGVSTTASGETFGMCYVKDLGYLSIYQYGFRVFDFTAKTATVFSGQATAGGGLDSTTDKIIDTQFKYEII